jgi:hypothetical protein
MNNYMFKNNEAETRGGAKAMVMNCHKRKMGSDWDCQCSFMKMSPLKYKSGKFHIIFIPWETSEI